MGSFYRRHYRMEREECLSPSKEKEIKSHRYSKGRRVLWKPRY